MSLPLQHTVSHYTAAATEPSRSHLLAPKASGAYHDETPAVITICDKAQTLHIMPVWACTAFHSSRDWSHITSLFPALSCPVSRFVDKTLQLSNLPALSGYLFGGSSASNILGRWDGDVVAGTFDELAKQVRGFKEELLQAGCAARKLTACCKSWEMPTGQGCCVDLLLVGVVAMSGKVLQ